jgi:hypothetical protein
VLLGLSTETAEPVAPRILEGPATPEEPDSSVAAAEVEAEVRRSEVPERTADLAES